jgi:superfamily I DNA/RNA helicase
MSLHKSKGLTASLVVVAGCVQGALPSIKTGAGYPSPEAQLEEQRRLFYVAITRATDTLVVSSSAHMQLADAMSGGISFRGRPQGGTVRTTASPYIAELGRAAPRTISTADWRRYAGF